MIGTFKVVAIIALVWISMFGLIILGNRLAETGTRMYNCSMTQIGSALATAS